MTHLVAVTRQKHTQKFWTRVTSYDFAAKEPVAPLVGTEMSRAALSLPIAFINHKENFLPAAVLSLTPGTNLFVAPNGRWLGEYIPAAFRGYPFRLARGGEKNDLLLCVDEDSGLVTEDRAAGEPFFDDTGALSQPVKEIMNFLTRVEQNRAATAARMAVLAASELLVAWPLKIKAGDAEKPVSGLYRIDEKKLNGMDDAPFLTLRRAGALPIVYSQLLAMGNIRMLEKMAAARTKMQQKTPDITAVFGDDDIITFQ